LLSGIAAALWLLGLLAAAPALRSNEPYTFADRLRDALLLGVAIPLVLGFLGLLYPATCWLALAILVIVSGARRARALEGLSGARRARAVEARPPYILIAALALIAWPPLMRPLLDGDTLSYHLPNAAAWVHAHGVWTTDSRYWWYPPASEMFAAGLFAVSGPFALGWSGFGAIALLGFRIVAFAREEFGAPAWLADSLGAATVTMTPLALQAGSLQNDVWLAALFIESLWTIRTRSSAAMLTVAITALLKPYGWLFVAVAAAAGKAPLRVWIAGALAFAIWTLHDALLWHTAMVTPGSASSANTWQSTILAHGLPALALLARVAAVASPLALPALVAALFGPLVAGDHRRDLGWAALAAFALFLLMPLAYADTHPQLATGASLRYAAPAFALGALLLARPATFAPRVVTVLFTLCAALGCAVIMATFWNDGGTRFALAISLIAVVNVAVANATGIRWTVPAGFVLAALAAAYLAARFPANYFTDALRVDGRTSGVYAWIAHAQPSVVGGWGLRSGIVNVLAPAARTLDLPDGAACADAAQQRATLVAVAENDRSPAFNAQRLDTARACARAVLFHDGIAVISSM